jgi:hypothetical protein
MSISGGEQIFRNVVEKWASVIKTTIKEKKTQINHPKNSPMD